MVTGIQTGDEVTHRLENDVAYVQFLISDKGVHEDGLKKVARVFMTGSRDYIFNK